MQYKSINLYTDGSCSNNQQQKNTGGWGFIAFDVLQPDDKVEGQGVFKNTTNQKMELQACIEGLRQAVKRWGSDGNKINIAVYSDSAYLVNCITKEWYVAWEENGWHTARKTPVKNQKQWQEILTLLRTTNIVEFNFYKVKAHAGNKWNIYVDALATNYKLR